MSGCHDLGSARNEAVTGVARPGAVAVTVRGPAATPEKTSIGTENSPAASAVAFTDPDPTDQATVTAAPGGNPRPTAATT
jgi:hypothetical protein